MLSASIGTPKSEHFDLSVVWTLAFKYTHENNLYDAGYKPSRPMKSNIPSLLREDISPSSYAHDVSIAL